MLTVIALGLGVGLGAGLGITKGREDGDSQGVEVQAAQAGSMSPWLPSVISVAPASSTMSTLSVVPGSPEPTSFLDTR